MSEHMPHSIHMRSDMLARDRRTRRLLLEFIDRAKSNECEGWITGCVLYDMLRSALHIDAPNTDQDVISLLRDLVIKEYVLEQDLRTDRTQSYGLDVLRFRITGSGISLVNYSIPHDPDIDDPRC